MEDGKDSQEWDNMSKTQGADFSEASHSGRSQSEREGGQTCCCCCPPCMVCCSCGIATTYPPRFC